MRIKTFREFITAWVEGKLPKGQLKCGNYATNKKRTKLTYAGYGRNLGYHQEKKEETLAIKLKDGRILGNAAKLQRCGSYLRGDEAPAQRTMFEMNIAMVPYNVFQEAGLNIRTAEVVEQGKEEDFTLPRLEWNDNKAMLTPVEIYFTDNFKKEPFDDDKKKVITKEKEDEYVRDKNGYTIKHKNGAYKMCKVWKTHYLDKTQLTKRHFVGAMLLKVANKHFLFDVDRKELPHYRFNPFLAELPRPAKTIKEAYEMLKPTEVKKALKRGQKVQRQGEWFFIPTRIKEVPKLPELPKRLKNIKEPKRITYDLAYWDEDSQSVNEFQNQYNYKNVKPKYRTNLLRRAKDYIRAKQKYEKLKEKKKRFEQKNVHYRYGGELQAGDNRPNKASEMFVINGQSYVKGTIKHTGREHEPITLATWHKAIPNTATKSFTITGNID